MARWDGAAWQALGAGLNFSVNALVVLPTGEVVAGGEFTNADGNATADYIARFDGTAWQPLGGGGLVMGGSFQAAGGVAQASGVARWLGGQWQALGSGLSAPFFDPPVSALALAPNGDIVAGGDFLNAGGNPLADHIARFDGTAWQPLGSGLDGEVFALLVLPSEDVVAGGIFYATGDDSLSSYCFGIYGRAPVGLPETAVASPAAGFTLYPNLSTGAAWVQPTAAAAVLPLTITDLTGRVVYARPALPATDGPVALPALPAGVYTVRLGSVVRRWVVGE